MDVYDKNNVKYTCPDCGYDGSKPKMFSRTVKCTNTEVKCNGIAILRQCPSCDHDIPLAVLETKNLPFSIIGVPGSGKTNYITVMLHELKKSAGLKLALSHQDKETRDHQSKHYKMIYEDLEPPPANVSGEITPQIWSIKNLAKIGKNKVPTYTFTIFDGAGEDHKENIDANSAVVRYINMSEAIIFVLDPLTISAIRNEGHIDQKVIQNSLGGGTGEVAFAQDIINDIANYIRSMNPGKYRSDSRIKIPVAVVMSKFDTVWSHHSFGQDPLVRNPSLTIENGKISVEEIEEVNQEVQDWLREIDEDGLLATLDANFPNHKFFGVSSYGKPPKDASTLNKPHPHRVLDPILWLFKSKKFID